MYSPIIIAKHLEVAQREIHLSATPFDLAYSSLARVDAYSAHLSSLINLDLWREKRRVEFRDPKRQAMMRDAGSGLYPDEAQWIKNELTLATFDYSYFASRYAYIKDALGGGLIHYAPNIAQQILNDVRGEMEAAYLAICLLQLKARQAGISTDNQIALTQRILFYPDTVVLTASSDPDKTAKMFEKMKLVLDNMPWWMIPPGMEWKDSGESRLISPSELRTEVILQHGNQKSGISRGDTVNACHLTEVPDFCNPDADIDSSLIKAMHFNPETLFCMESTAKWTEDWWHRKWRNAELYYPQGKYRFRPLFLPWIVSSDLYPTATEVRQFFEPVRATWKPQPITIKMAMRAQHDVEHSALLRKYLGATWRMSKEQMWFWEWDREQARIDRRLGDWLSEMPTSSDEAFQIKGSKLFDTELLQDLRASAKPILLTAQIVGSDITPRMWPYGVQVDHAFEPIPVYADLPNYTGEFALQPLVVTDYSTFDPHGKLIVWEMPSDDEEYYCIVDSALDGSDNLVADMWRKGDGARYDEQVAQFATPDIGGSDVWPLIMAIGCFYKVVWNKRDLREPQMVIELAKGGRELQNALRMRGWKNFYVPIPMAGRKLDASKGTTLGWDMNLVTRDECLSTFIPAVRERGEHQYFQINSKWTIGEIGSFGKNPRKQKLEALGGAKDDRVITAAIASFAMHVLALRGRGETPYDRRRRQLEIEESERVVYDTGHMGRARPSYDIQRRFDRSQGLFDNVQLGYEGGGANDYAEGRYESGLGYTARAPYWKRKLERRG